MSTKLRSCVTAYDSPQDWAAQTGGANGNALQMLLNG